MVPGVYRSWSKGCEWYLGCTGPGARDVNGTWGVRVPGGGEGQAEVKDRKKCAHSKVTYMSTYGSWSKGCEWYLGCTGPVARDVNGTWGVHALEQGT